MFPKNVNLFPFLFSGVGGEVYKFTLELEPLRLVLAKALCSLCIEREGTLDWKC